MKADFGVDSMPETAENVADEFAVSRADQDRFAAESQRRAAAAQASGRMAVMRLLGLADDAAHVNPNGGAIALGHPLGMSGARLVLTATEELIRGGGQRALCTMCIGVGQGLALAIERV